MKPSIPVKTSLKQIHIIIKLQSNQNLQKKLSERKVFVQKLFARLEKIFSHINFSLSQKQRYEQKALSFRSALHFCSAPKSIQIFSRVSFPVSKITPLKLIEKKEFSNTPLRVVKTALQ